MCIFGFFNQWRRQDLLQGGAQCPIAGDATAVKCCEPLRRCAAVGCVWSDAGHGEALQVVASALQCGQLTAGDRQVHHSVIPERNERQVRRHLRRVTVAVGEQR